MFHVEWVIFQFWDYSSLSANAKHKLCIVISINKINIKKYHTVGTVPKSNTKMIERGQIDTPTKQMHDHSLSLLSW